MINRNFRWIPPILWGMIIAVLSLIPGGPGNWQFLGIPYIDKIGHFGMYGFWTFLFVIALSGNAGISRRKAMWVAILIGVLTGLLLEIIQNLMHLGRVFEIADLVANTLGAITGAWVRFNLKK